MVSEEFIPGDNVVCTVIQSRGFQVEKNNIYPNIFWGAPKTHFDPGKTLLFYWQDADSGPQATMQQEAAVLPAFMSFSLSLRLDGCPTLLCKGFWEFQLL